MPLLNFRAQFAPLVESGEKAQTIRARRKDGRDPKVGDLLYLYTGCRTKAARKLGEAVVTKAIPFAIAPPVIAIDDGPNGAARIYGIDERRIRDIARRDGFENGRELVEWFRQVHGLPFRGVLIRWSDFRPADGDGGRG